MIDKPSRTDELDITFFVPCLNEERFIVPTIETILAGVKGTDVSYEILVSDDHSSDGTAEKVEEYRKKHPELPLTLIRKDANRGMVQSYIEGAAIAKGKYYYMVGGDDDVPVEYVVTILEKLHSADVIIPSFTRDTRHPVRAVLSKLYIKLVNLLSGYSLKYYNGAVHLRANVLKYDWCTRGSGYLAELLVRVLNEGASYIQVSAPMRDKKSDVISEALMLPNIISVGRSLVNIFLLRFKKNTCGHELTA